MDVGLLLMDTLSGDFQFIWLTGVFIKILGFELDITTEKSFAPDLLKWVELS